MQAPRVTVLMGVYNGEQYLHQAIESVLNQTFIDFEFIIIDDGSTDATGQILSNYSAQDKRIVLIRNEENIGLTRSLNKGLRFARGEYIARMDADDVNLPHRLAQQVAFLAGHPAIGVAGAAVRYLDESGNLSDKISSHVGSAGLLRWWLCFENPLRHPTVMMRRVIVNQVGGYDIHIPLSQDKDLWQRISEITDLANLSEVLLYRRQHRHSVSHQQRDRQRRCSLINSQRMMSRLLGEEIPLNRVENILQDTMTLPHESQAIASVLYRLAQVCLVHPSLTQQERAYICSETSRRILRRCLQHKAHWRTWVQLFYVLRLDANRIKTGIRKGFFRRLQRSFQFVYQGTLS